jgi:CHAT domain-containing protein
VLRLIGRISYDRGQSNEAALTFKKALALDEQAENQAGQAQSLCLLSQLSLAIGQNQAALEYADRALKLVTSLKVSEFQWRAWVALARAQRALGRSEEAYKSFCWALSFIEKNRLVSLSADAFRISFLTERQAVYRELVDLLVERGQAEGAFNAAEFARSRATVDLLAQLGGGEEQQPTPEQAKRLEEGAQRVERLRAQWRSPGLSSQQREALQAALPEAEQRLEEARMEADMNRQMRFTRPTLLRQVQEAVLRPDEALIEFLLGEKHSYVWVISREQANYAALPGRKEIEESVRRYLDVVATRPNALHINRALAKQAESADRLFQLLLGPVAEHLTPDQRLIIVPDGLLHYLPFETLIREGRFLIEQYEISYTPSASVLGLLSARVDRSGQRELLAVGDPVYGPRVPSLPNSRREVQAISEFFPPDARQLYLGPDATEAAMKREPLDRYRIFHLAVHSLIDERFPARSGVMLSVADDPADDGFLDVSEITKLKLDCDLVVLSACQTGRGRLVTGEGIIGFTRAFLYAGARRVAVSLWGVSDLSTAQFMKCFYKHLATRSSPAAALRQAKLDWLSSNNAMRHPFYWAPFVLIGK